MITVLLRYDHHVDHTFLEATHYRNDSVLKVYVGKQEVARFRPALGTASTAMKAPGCEKDGRERTAQRLEVRVKVAD